MIISFPRLTIRLHDNSLLEKADCTVYILEQERVPNAKSLNRWSFHQFNLLIQSLIYHKKELNESGHKLYVLLLSKKNARELINRLKRTHQLITDLITDPAHSNNIKQTVSTFTLLDWSEPEHHAFLKSFWPQAKIYGKLTKIKDYVSSRVPKPIMNTKPKKTPAHKLDIRYPEVDLSKLLAETQSRMTALGMTPHQFPNTEQKLLAYAKKAINYISAPSWYKPKTSIGTNYGERSKKSNKNTSQLSPFLSIGALSPRFFWHQIKTKSAAMGSARDQLLFRESFHTVALAQKFGVPGRVQNFWKNDSTFTSNDYRYKSSSSALKRWKEGEMTGACSDANQSMKELWQLGWIHHLKRHLVADVLTRGQLQLHYKHGENWFRLTLLDHDAVVNRCNWMWLAAEAFSSKQKVYHYNPESYVKRNTYG